MVEAHRARKLWHAIQGITDEEWQSVVRSSVHGGTFRGLPLPAFPDAAIQYNYVGSSGEVALREAEELVQDMLRYGRAAGIAFGEQCKIADFGIGWGRIARLAMKYAGPDGLYGLEVSPQMVDLCRDTFRTGQFLTVDYLPPTPLRTGLLDVIYGYSVFSHLAEPSANAWIQEFARLLKPGGLVLQTTRKRTFIDDCERVRRTNLNAHAEHPLLANCFVDTDAAYAAYDRGEFVHGATGQMEGTYGETLIPKGYIEKHWCTDFELVDFKENRLDQALFVLRRR